MNDACKTCRRAKKYGLGSVYCLLMGIVISADHKNCRYHTGRIEGYDTTGKGRNEMDITTKGDS
jgi:hypothetical protein